MKNCTGMMTRSRAASIVAVLLTVMPAALAMANTDIVINEVFYDGATAADDWIELKNVGASNVDVSNWLFCARFSYNLGRISSMVLLDGNDLVLGPGEIITVQSWTNLNNTSSDLGLYTSTLFGSAAAMVDFVQWGTASDVGRSDVAAAKGIWTQSGPGVFDFVPTTASDESTSYTGTNSGGGLLTLSTDFSNGTPTRGMENTLIPVEQSSWGAVKALYRSESTERADNGRRDP